MVKVLKAILHVFYIRFKLDFSAILSLCSLSCLRMFFLSRMYMESKTGTEKSKTNTSTCIYASIGDTMYLQSTARMSSLYVLRTDTCVRIRTNKSIRLSKWGFDAIWGHC